MKEAVKTTGMRSRGLSCRAGLATETLFCAERQRQHGSSCQKLKLGSGKVGYCTSFSGASSEPCAVRHREFFVLTESKTLRSIKGPSRVANHLHPSEAKRGRHASLSHEVRL
jgi:hypothetical protein